MAGFEQTYAGVTARTESIQPVSTKKVSRARITVVGNPNGTISPQVRPREAAAGTGIAVGYTTPAAPTTVVATPINAAGTYDLYQDGFILDLVLALGAAANCSINVTQMEG